MIDVTDKVLAGFPTSWLDVHKVLAMEQYSRCNFVGQLCLKDINGNWVNEFAYVFYEPMPNVELNHTHYFAIIKRNGSTFITKGDSSVEGVFAGIEEDGIITISRYRHDFRQTNSGAIDGGRDYTKIVGSPKVVSLKVENGRWFKIESE